MTHVSFAQPQEKGHPKGWHNYFANDARWRRRSFSASQWRSLYHPTELHFIFGFQYLSCHNFEVDELHVMHLGTTMYMLGAGLYMLVFHVLDGSPEDNMHGIWAGIREFYKRHSCDTVFQLGDWILPSA